MRTVDGKLSCSAGVAVYPDDAAEPAELIGCADAALYTAKTTGKGRTRGFEPSEPVTGFGSTDAEQIQRLLTEEGAIEIAYQPVVALATGRVVGYEALSRFQAEPERPTSAWFGQAHACGLGPELEAAAVRAALQPIGRPPGRIWRSTSARRPSPRRSRWTPSPRTSARS